MTAEKIRMKLKCILDKEPENTDEILRLTSELAKLDETKVRFSVDAGVVDRLGKELVARHETAVSELIKNAYDADATKVDLFFQNVDEAGGVLHIEDTGMGMNRQQLINGFMRISSTDKVKTPISLTFNRKRAGRKGIGRFATQRLGEKLTITTQTSGAKQALRVTIDWNKYRMDEDLSLITNKIEEIPLDSEKVSGTTLIIEHLREAWSDAMVKRVYRYSLDVIQPFPLSKKKVVDGAVTDPGFKINCFREGKMIADENTMFYNHALAEIEGYVNKMGQGFWEIKSSKVDAITNEPQFIENDKNNENTFKYLNGVKFKAYYFLYRPAKMASMMPKQIETYVKDIANEKGGIRVYKNGFRVLPYAEPDDDWLGLDASTVRRTILPTHRNINFFGFVELGGENKNFQELSSREGLLQNEAFQELRSFVFQGIINAVNRVAAARGTKTRTNQKDWQKKEKKPQDVVKEVVSTLNSIADNFSNLNRDTDRLDDKLNPEKIRSQAKELDEALDTLVEELDETSMLRVLAGLGLIIGEFTHEIMKYMGAFDADAQYLVDNLHKDLEAYNRAKRLQETFRSFQVYASYFDTSISQNVNRELEVINLKKTIINFKSTLEYDLRRSDIKLEVEFRNIEIYTAKMHKSEWASILFNLYSNAKKAIKRAKPIERKIKIIAGVNGDSVYLHFMDNGDGIPKENQEKIFNAFFTTSSPRESGHHSKNDFSGTGLGLSIVNDIINGYDGDILLDNPSENYSTNFRIEIPKASDEEIEELWHTN